MSGPTADDQEATGPGARAGGSGSERRAPRRGSTLRDASTARIHYAWVVLGVSTLAVFGVLGLGRFGYTMVLPAMQDQLGLTNTQSGALATANLVGYAIMSLVGGAFAARYGTRLVVTVGLVLAGVGMLLTGLAWGFASAAAFRFLTGMGSGLANVPATALAGAWFAARRRGTASGVVVTGSSLGLIVVGPLVPAVLGVTGPQGWPTVWYIFAAVDFVLAVAVYALLRNRPTDKGLHPVGDPPAPIAPTVKPLPVTSIRTGLGAAAPGAAEPAAGAGLQWGSVYRSRVVWHLGIVYSALGLSYFIYLTFFTKYLITDGGYTQGAAGALYMLLGWCSLISGTLWGTISDRIGRKWALAIVYLIHAFAFSLFALWPTPMGFTLSAVIFGVCAWASPAIMAAVSGDLLGPRLAPAALGFVTLFFAVAQAAGPSLAGAIADATGGFEPAFLLASAVAVLGSIASVLLPRSTGRSHRA